MYLEMVSKIKSCFNRLDKNKNMVQKMREYPLVSGKYPLLSGKYPLVSGKAAAVAQSVEQRTENPCVISSILIGGR